MAQQPSPTGDKQLKTLTTVNRVIRQLGGTAAVARLTGCGVTAVCNWRARGRFPTRFYALMTGELCARGFIARPQLWGQQGASAIRLTKRSGQTLSIAA